MTCNLRHPMGLHLPVVYLLCESIYRGDASTISIDSHNRQSICCVNLCIVSDPLCQGIYRGDTCICCLILSIVSTLLCESIYRGNASICCFIPSLVSIFLLCTISTIYPLCESICCIYLLGESIYSIYLLGKSIYCIYLFDESIYSMCESICSMCESIYSMCESIYSMCESMPDPQRVSTICSQSTEIISCTAKQNAINKTKIPIHWERKAFDMVVWIPPLAKVLPRREVGGWGRDPFQEISWNLRPVVNGT